MKLDTSVAIAVLAFISSVSGIIVTNRYAAKAARKAQESAERQKTAQIDAEAYARAREQYEAGIVQQDRRIANLRTEMHEDREEYKREVIECRRRIEGLERDMAALRRWGRVMIVSARAVGAPHPQPPVWLGEDDTDPGLHAPKRED